MLIDTTSYYDTLVIAKLLCKEKVIQKVVFGCPHSPFKHITWHVLRVLIRNDGTEFSIILAASAIKDRRGAVPSKKQPIFIVIGR